MEALLTPGKIPVVKISGPTLCRKTSPVISSLLMAIHLLKLYERGGDAWNRMIIHREIGGLFEI
jgi:hypothetical protein